jgi:hypothetical protein
LLEIESFDQQELLVDCPQDLAFLVLASLRALASLQAVEGPGAKGSAAAAAAIALETESAVGCGPTGP